VKRALVVGIDAYPKHPLTGCANDAIAMGTVLETLGNGDPNFSVIMLTSQDQKVGSEEMHLAVAKLFSGDAETVLLYFAGHGIINRETNSLRSRGGKSGN
jgi:Caspase domain